MLLAENTIFVVLIDNVSLHTNFTFQDIPGMRMQLYPYGTLLISLSHVRVHFDYETDTVIARVFHTGR